MNKMEINHRRDVAITDIEGLLPKNHLVRKLEKVMDYDWIYEKVEPYYRQGNGRPCTDPVVLVKMVLLQHLFGIASLRQTHREIEVNIAYRWFLGYGLPDNIAHFATVSYAFCKRFLADLASEDEDDDENDGENGVETTTNKEGKIRHALYPPSRPAPCHSMGHA